MMRDIAGDARRIEVDTNVGISSVMPNGMGSTLPYCRARVAIYRHTRRQQGIDSVAARAAES